MGAKSVLAKGYEKFLNDAKELGYNGGADVEDVLAFASDKGIKTRDEDRIRKAYKAYRVEVLEESDAGIVIGIMNDDAGEAEMSDEDEAKGNGQDEEVAKGLKSIRDRLAKAELEVKNLRREAEAKPRIEVSTPGEKDFRRLQRKGRTVFDTAKDAHAFGLWMLAGTELGSKVGQDRRSAAVKSLENMGIKANTTSFTQDGGAAVPEQFVADIWDFQSIYGVARGYSDVQPMSSDSAKRPKNNGGDGAGYVAYFTAEASAPTLSQMVLASVPLNAKRLEVLGKISRELLDDSAVNLGEFAARSITTVMQKKEDECLFIGDGTSSYGGINGLGNQFGATATADARSVTGGGTASAHTLANLHSLMAKLPSQYRADAKFYCHPTMVAEIFDRLLGAQGGVSWQETADNGFIKRALGHEIVEVNVMPSAIDASGDQIDVYFGNLPAAAMFGDRRSIEVETNPHTFWDEGVIGIKGYDRFDINVHELGSTTAAGPIVALYQT